VDVRPDGFVFSHDVDGENPISPDTVTALLGWARDQLGLRHVHLHSLRHFNATILAAEPNITVRTVAGRLGHADASVTMKTYARFFPASDVEAADVVGNALQPTGPNELGESSAEI
jgi:integrase